MNTDFSNLSKMPLYIWIALAIILFSQGIWLFLEARKVKTNKWFWGLWGLIQFPTPILIYLLVYHKKMERKQVKLILTLVIVITLIIATGVVFNYLK